MQPSRSTTVGPATRERLAANLRAVEERVRTATERAGRTVPPTLVAVTKTVGAAATSALVELGCEDLGENRADAFVDKARALDGADPAPRWHFIGHLQRNKARRVLERCHVLHSVDGPRLAETVARLTTELGRDVDAYVEVNLTGEPEKHGLDPAADAAALEETLRLLADAPHVRLAGLMAMGPLAGRPGARSVADVFADASSLARRLENEFRGAFAHDDCRLSMGMSGDLEEAVRHGSSLVRVGSALFDGLNSSDLA